MENNYFHSFDRSFLEYFLCNLILDRNGVLRPNNDFVFILKFNYISRKNKRRSFVTFPKEYLIFAGRYMLKAVRRIQKEVS